MKPKFFALCLCSSVVGLSASVHNCGGVFGARPTLRDAFVIVKLARLNKAPRFAGQTPKRGELAPNRWIEIGKDSAGARRGCAIRYAADAGAFFLWGFMNADPELPQEQPLAEVPEYDVVFFDPAEGRWRDHLPKEWESKWTHKRPLAYFPRTYSGITTGSERTILHGPTSQLEGVARPDLNLVFDQVVYHPPSRSLIYFTGGLTAAYDVIRPRWSDLAPTRTPPPVVGGSLAYDPLNDEMVLFGGGHVAERRGGGKIVGYTSTWVYSFRERNWRRLDLEPEPQPRMNMRLVCDTRNQFLALFGGDGQSHYLADTWLYSLKSRTWKASRARQGPPPRAGHFTVYDPDTGWVIIGGGYNRKDLGDMWAYDAKQDLWHRLQGEVPSGFYLSADIAPEKRLILLTTATRAPADRTNCNTLYPVRTTYAYRIEREQIVTSSASEPLVSMPKRAPEEASSAKADALRGEAQAKRLQNLPVNQWIHLADPARTAPARTWGTATFDLDRGLLLYWGGGHCGYGGSDVDAYDIEAHTWRSSDPAPEYPERTWDKGVRLAGVTFQGKPWTDHGRRIYAYDPVSHKTIMVRPIRLTADYDPEALRSYPAWRSALADALVNPPSSYVRYATWTYDTTTAEWLLAGGAAVGIDTLVTTPRGVMGINVHWQIRLNDAGYLLPYDSSQKRVEKSLYLSDAARAGWERLSNRGPTPQNLYEMTSLAYDSRRDQVILHGGGPKHDELWVYELKSGRWINRNPKVAAPEGSAHPVCAREAVYIPAEDVFFTYGPAPEDRSLGAVWVYTHEDNAWRRVDVPPPPGIEKERRAGQNRALVYDPKRNLLLLALGRGGDAGETFVYALRYRHAQARFMH